MKMFHNRRIDRQMMRLEIVPANADQTTKHAKTTIQLYEKKAIKNTSQGEIKIKEEKNRDQQSANF